MFYLNVCLQVNNPADVERVRALLATMVAGVREEPGLERFVVYQSESVPGFFLLNEHWRSREDWENHRQGRMCKEIYEPLVLPLVTRTPHVASLVE